MKLMLKSRNAFYVKDIALLSVIQVLFIIQTFSQVAELSGRVVDFKSLEPLPFANVFINNTTIGTSTDVNGEFILKGIPLGSAELVFSYVGYQSYQRTVIVKNIGNVLPIVKLVQDQKQLGEVEIKGTRDKVWERQLKRFERFFLGSNKNAKSCVIKNPWVLEFSETDGSFSAKASAELEIENNILGYKLIYYLKDFKSSSEGYSIQGNCRFELLPTSDPATMAKWDANRIDAYKGSLRHLLKSILTETSKEEGFFLYANPFDKANALRQSVFSLNKDIVPYEPMKSLNGTNTRILMKGKVEVHFTQRYPSKRVYEDLPYSIGWIETQGDVIDVTSSGLILNPGKVVTSGYFNEARVADQLPLDYNYSPTIVSLKSGLTFTSTALANNRAMRLREGVYLHTDKPYYYKGELVWFKGYLNYVMPTLRDSLSKVLYVDVLNNDKNLIYSNKLLIEKGTVVGNLLMPDSLQGGLYWIRAYTKWMLNYGAENLFVKPIYLLDLNQRVVSDNKEIEYEKSDLVIISSKSEYSTREQITINFSLYNPEREDTLSLRADLSVSVTDANQVGVNEKRRINTFFEKMAEIPVSNYGVSNKMEKSFSIEGILLSNKGTPIKSDLVIIQGKFEKLFTLQSDNSGYFRLDDLAFKDTVRFTFQAAKKNVDKILLKSFTSPKLGGTYESPNFKIVESPYLVPVSLNFDKKTRVLDELEISSTRVPQNSQPLLLTNPQYIITREDIKKSPRGNVLTVLQGKVPGMQVTSNAIRMSGTATTFLGSNEPLLLVNGAQASVDQLIAITENEIDRIEIIRDPSPTYGTRGANGVIAVSTATQGSGDFDKVKSVKNSNYVEIIPIVGFKSPEEFKSPDYGVMSKSHESDDFRSTIFWEPNLKLDKFGKASLSFYAADLKTTYRIVVEGIDEMGKPIYADAIIHIK
jgi:hypothetical protein